MNIKPLSQISLNKVQFSGTKKKQTQKSEHIQHSSSMHKAVPLAVLIAMSPLTTPNTMAQDKLPQKPDEILAEKREKEQPKTKILDVKTFFNVNGENYIVRTKSTDGDNSNFESITVSQATPKSRGAKYETEEVSKYNFAPYTDDIEANNGFFTVDGVKVKDIDTQRKLIGNEEFIKYFEKLANSPANNGAIKVVNHNENLVPLPSGRVIISYEDGNLWQDAEPYTPKGEYMGHRILEGDNGIYDIAIYNSDDQTLTAEEFTLKKEGCPELRIDKMFKVKSNFVSDHNEPISYETYQFNLTDDDGVTTVIYDKTLGEYMERVCKSPLYEKDNVPFDKADLEKDYKISASTNKIYNVK